MRKQKTLKKIAITLAFIIAALAMAIPVMAATGDTDAAADATLKGMKAIGAGIAIGLGSLGGAIGMGIASSKSIESVARQPEAEGKIRTQFMLGLVFIETAIIYALLVVIIIIFVL